MGIKYLELEWGICFAVAMPLVLVANCRYHGRRHADTKTLSPGTPENTL